MNFRSLIERRSAHQLVANSAWSAIGEAIFRGSALLTTAVVARLLGPADFGLYGFVRNSAAQFAGIGAAGLGVTALRFMGEFRQTAPEKAAALIGSSLVLSAALGFLLGATGILLAPLIAGRLLGDPGLEQAVRLAAVLVALGGINVAQIGIVQGFEAFRSLAGAFLVSSVGAGIVTIALTILFGVTGALGGLALSALLSLFLFQWLIHRQARAAALVGSWWEWSSIRPILWRFSLPIALSAVALGPLRWLVEARLIGTAGLEEAGLFYAAMLVFAVLVGIVGTLYGPVTARLAALEAAGGSARMRQISLLASWYVYAALAVPILLVPALPGLLLGGAFASDAFLIVLLPVIGYGAVTALSQGLTRAVVQWGNQWFQLLLAAVEGVSLAAGFLLLAHMGALGLALACLVSSLARLAVALPIVVRAGYVTAGSFLDPWLLLSMAIFLLLLGVQLVAVG